MAKVLPSDKGFKLIATTNVEMVAIGSYGICDSCNDLPERGVYVAVLNYWMCEKCFKDWHKRAKYYQQDAEFEDRGFQFYKKKLNAKEADIENE